jgi:thiosulfate reductase cytochrome b subunit
MTGSKHFIFRAAGVFIIRGRQLSSACESEERAIALQRIAYLSFVFFNLPLLSELAMIFENGVLFLENFFKLILVFL